MIKHCISVTGVPGLYTAEVFYKNFGAGYYRDLRFFGYTKKEVFRELRRQYGVTVSRRVCAGYADYSC